MGITKMTFAGWLVQWVVLVTVFLGGGNIADKGAMRQRHDAASSDGMPVSSSGSTTAFVAHAFKGIPGIGGTDDGYDVEMGKAAICWESRHAGADQVIAAAATTGNGDQGATGADAAPSNEEEDALTTSISFEFPNVLVADYVTNSEGVKLLKSCPGWNQLKSTFAKPTSPQWQPRPGTDQVVRVDRDTNDSDELAKLQPNASVRDEDVTAVQNQRFRTGTWYNFTVDVFIDLVALPMQFIISDPPKGQEQEFMESGLPRYGRIAVQVVACDTESSGFCSPFVHEQANARLVASGETLSKTAPGELHGDTHIHSPYVFIEVDSSEKHTKIHQTVEVPMLVNHPGSYSMIGGAMWFVGNPSPPDHASSSGEGKDSGAMTMMNQTAFSLQSESSKSNVTDIGLYRYDMANAMVDTYRVIHFQEPAVILEVSKEVQWISYAAIAITAAIVMFLLINTIRYREESVFQLSQVQYLVAFQVAALVASVSSALLQPHNTVFCYLSKPLVLCSMQLMYAIHIARVWRVHEVISPILKQQIMTPRRSPNDPDDSTNAGWIRRCHDVMVSKLSQCCGLLCPCNKSATLPSKQSSPRQKGGLRRQVPQWKVIVVIIIVMIPQIILQILGCVLQCSHRAIEFNDDESIGRATCIGQNVTSIANSIFHYSIYALLLSLILLLWMAHTSSKLPSLFDESKAIYNSTVVSGFLWMFGLGIIAITDSPTISPDVQYLTSVVMVLSVTLNLTLKLIWPKLRLVWSGKQVLVSSLVAEHRQRLSDAAAADSANPLSSSIRVSGLYPPPSQSHISQGFLQSSSSHLRTSAAYPGADEGSHSAESSSLIGDTIFDHRVPQKPASFARSITPTERSNSTLDLSSLEAGGLVIGSRRKSTGINDPSMKNPPTRKSSAARLNFAGIIEVEDDATDSSSEQYDPISPSAKKMPPSSAAPASSTPSSSMHRGQQGRKDGGTQSKGGSSRSAPTKSRNSSRPASSTTNKIVIKEGVAPSKTLVLGMVQLNQQISLVTQTVMSGLSVSRNEWESLRDLTGQLGLTFQDGIDFEWERQGPREERAEIKPLVPSETDQSDATGTSNTTS